MTTMTRIDEERRRKNSRLAWILAAFVLLIVLSSVPFWKGLFELAVNNG